MNDKNRSRLLMRTAARMHAQYVARTNESLFQRLESTDGMLSAHIGDLQRAERLLIRSQQCGLPLCQSRLRHRYERTLQKLTQCLEQMKQRWHEPWTQPPHQRDLYEELSATHDEFGGVECDWYAKTIAVQTDRIVLEGLPLGSFRIVIDAGLIPRSDPASWYRVEAMESNPACTNESITHPHVDGDHLCAGDALVPIDHALRQGRLCDFFVLVRSVLETYNPHSAYVEIEQWDGISCHDCGYVVHSENSYYCESCEYSFCDECMSSCEVCHTTQCRGCLMRTELSNMYVCDSCCAHCSGCERLCTLNELDEDLCSSCQEQLNEQEDTHDDNQETTQENNQEAHSSQGQAHVVASSPNAQALATSAGADALGQGVAQAAVPVPRR